MMLLRRADILFVLLVCNVLSEAAPLQYQYCGSSELILTDKEYMILDGAKAHKSEVPWIGSLQVVKNGAWVQQCGVTVIQAGVLVTAAHCLFEWVDVAGRWSVRVPYQSNRLRVQLASVTLDLSFSTSDLHYKVSSLVVHPLYNVSDSANHRHDIAVIFLENSEMPPEAKAVCVPEEFELLDESSPVSCMTMGWGATHTALSTSILNYRRIPLQQDDKCSEEWHITPTAESSQINSRFDPASMICAGIRTSQGFNGAGACTGDSGGPLICSRGNRSSYLMGIVSFGHYQCLKKTSVFTRVSFYQTWIQQLLSQRNIKFPLLPRPQAKSTSRVRAEETKQSRKTSLNRAVTSPPLPAPGQNNPRLTPHLQLSLSVIVQQAVHFSTVSGIELSRALIQAVLQYPMLPYECAYICSRDPDCLGLYIIQLDNEPSWRGRPLFSCSFLNVTNCELRSRPDLYRKDTNLTGNKWMFKKNRC